LQQGGCRFEAGYAIHEIVPPGLSRNSVAGQLSLTTRWKAPEAQGRAKRLKKKKLFHKVRSVHREVLNRKEENSYGLRYR
jgi:hypothetical protein